MPLLRPQAVLVDKSRSCAASLWSRPWKFELQDVRKRFGDTEVLRGLTLRIASGQRVGFGRAKRIREKSRRWCGFCPDFSQQKAKSEWTVLIHFGIMRAFCQKVGYVPQTAPNLGTPFPKWSRRCAGCAESLSQLCKGDL